LAITFEKEGREKDTFETQNKRRMSTKPQLKKLMI
jgi:hypothetical protein